MMCARVWNVCTDVKLPSQINFPGYFSQQGGSGPFSSHCLTKTLLVGCDISLGRWVDVPAFSEWEEVQPKNLQVEYFIGRFRLFGLVSVRFSQSELRAWMINGNLWSGLRNRELRYTSLPAVPHEAVAEVSE